MTLHAKWTAKTYNVWLSQGLGNGGTTEVTATYGQPMPAATMPTRTGYTFGGYYTGAKGAGTQYYTASGASARNWDIDATDEYTMLYAKWTANSYTVTLKANNNQQLWPLVNATFPDGTANDKPFTATYGQKYPTLVSGVPSSPGYTFKNWYDGTSGSHFRDGVQLNDLTVEITTSRAFWAQWTANRYAVTLRANNNHSLWPLINARFPDGTANDKSLTATYGQNYPTLVSGVPSAPGYTFKNWYDATSRTHLRDGVQLNDLTVAITSNRVFYAQWTANTYLVTLSPGGSFYATYGQPMRTLTPLSREGYTFDGFFSSPDGGGVRYYNADGSPTKTYDIASDTTLYANFKKIVKLDVNTGCVDSGYGFPLAGARPLVAINSREAKVSDTADFVEGAVVTVKASATARRSAGVKGLTFANFTVLVGSKSTVYSGSQVGTSGNLKTLNVVVPSGAGQFSVTAYYSRDEVNAVVLLGTGSAFLEQENLISIEPAANTRRFGDAVYLTAAQRHEGATDDRDCVFYGWGRNAEDPLGVVSQSMSYGVTLDGDVTMYAHYASRVSVAADPQDGSGGTVSVSLGSQARSLGADFSLPFGASIRVMSQASSGFFFAGISFTPLNGSPAETQYGTDALIPASRNGAYVVSFQANPPKVYLACYDVAETGTSGNAGVTSASYNGTEQDAFEPVGASSVTGVDKSGIPVDARWYLVRQGLMVDLRADKAEADPLERKSVEFGEIPLAASASLMSAGAQQGQQGAEWVERSVAVAGHMFVETTWGVFAKPKVTLVPRTGGRAVFVGEDPAADGSDVHEKEFEPDGGVYLTTTVRAIPDPVGGYIFMGWFRGGQLVSPSADYTFEVRADVELVAAFALDDNAVFAWEGSARNKTMEWTSGVITVPRPSDPVATRVDAAKYPVEVDVQTHSSPDDGTVRLHFVGVTGQAARRLPRMRPERFWQVSVRADVEIDAVVVATNIVEAN